MNLTNPFATIVSFLRLFISRYMNIDLMGDRQEKIFNYLAISDRIATGGQPTEKQLSLLKNNGYQVVINLALPTSENALPNEQQSVESLGMRYVNIPIDFNHPTEHDFELFCQAMEDNKQQKLFVHCAANLRVSAFIYLYRQLYEDISEQQAKADLTKLWLPNKTWQTLIDFILKSKRHNLISH